MWGALAHRQRSLSTYAVKKGHFVLRRRSCHIYQSRYSLVRIEVPSLFERNHANNAKGGRISMLTTPSTYGGYGECVNIILETRFSKPQWHCSATNRHCCKCWSFSSTVHPPKCLCRFRLCLTACIYCLYCTVRVNRTKSPDTSEVLRRTDSALAIPFSSSRRRKCPISFEVSCARDGAKLSETCQRCRTSQIH